MSQSGYDLIKGFEGLRLEAYKDIGGVWTIGYGNTRYRNGSAVKEKDAITKPEAQDLFALWGDKSVDRLVGDKVLNQQQFDALVSFTYNGGSGAFSTSTLLKKVKDDPKDETIRDEFMKWVHVKKVRCQGLVNRRTKEADVYFS